MNLQAPPGAPLWMHVGASALLFAHIAGGTVGMASGTVALLTRKGGRAHRLAGDVFFGGMLSLTGAAAVTAPFLEARWTNTMMALFTLYLVSTGWMAVMRRPGQAGRFETVAMIGAACLVATAIWAGVSGLAAGDRTFGAVYLFSAITALGAVCDLTVIRRGGVSGPSRIARHIWRMCAGLAVALGSFFLGQQKFLPEAMRGSPWLGFPVLATLALMVFWLVRVRIGRAFRPSAPA